jgi:hypothetical protein
MLLTGAGQQRLAGGCMLVFVWSMYQSTKTKIDLSFVVTANED